MRPFLSNVQSWRDRWGVIAVDGAQNINGTRNTLQATCCLRALDEGWGTP